MNIRNSIILTLSVLCCVCAKPPKKVSILVVKPYAIEKDESGHPTPAGMTTIAEAVKARLNGQSQVYIAPYRHNCR